jgi:hypothetical protein
MIGARTRNASESSVFPPPNIVASFGNLRLQHPPRALGTFDRDQRSGDPKSAGDRPDLSRPLNAGIQVASPLGIWICGPDCVS